MQSQLNDMIADAHFAELQEHAQQHRAVRAAVRTRTPRHHLAAAVRGYFGHALAADQQSLRRTGR